MSLCQFPTVDRYTGLKHPNMLDEEPIAFFGVATEQFPNEQSVRLVRVVQPIVQGEAGNVSALGCLEAVRTRCVPQTSRASYELNRGPPCRKWFEDN